MIFLFRLIAAIYELADLEILYEQRNYKEYVDHMLDIRPSLRDETWETMTTTIVLEYMDQFINQDKYDLDFLHKIEEFSNLVLLQNDDFYNRRISYARVFFPKCYEFEKEKCKELMNEFWASTNDTFQDDIGVVFFNLANQLKVDNLPYLRRLTMDEEFNYCETTQIREAVSKRIIAINNPTKELVYNEANLACVRVVLNEFKKGTDEKKLKILELFEEYPEADKELFLTRYILEDPSVGKTFNDAWKLMEDLGKDHERRTSLIKKLEQEDLLPGKTFAISDIKRRDVLLNLIASNFPEYINLYAKKCLDYMGGKEFDKGNPTMECSDLFENENSKKWISSNDLTKFKELNLTKS